MAEAKQKKIAYIAIAQLIGCILVILGHSIPLNWQIPQVIYRADVFLYTFHMPLFFFVSGYLFYKTKSFERYTFGAYIKKRSFRLMLPYVALTLIGFIPKILTNRFFGDGARLSVIYFVKAFLVPRENVWGHFWFLPTLLLISLFSFAFAKLKNKSPAAYGIVTVLLFSLTLVPQLTDWFAVNDILKYTCFYALGLLFADSKAESVITGDKTKFVFLLLLPVSVGLFLIPVQNETAQTALNQVIGMMMLTFVLAVSQLADITKTKVGNFLCNKTYSIFILSWPFQSIVSIVFEKAMGLPYYITMPIAFAAGILGPIIVILIVDLIEKKIGKRILSPIIGG